MGLDSQSSLYDSWPLVCRPCALYRLCKSPPAGTLFSYSISSSLQLTQRPFQAPAGWHLYPYVTRGTFPFKCGPYEVAHPNRESIIKQNLKVFLKKFITTGLN